MRLSNISPSMPSRYCSTLHALTFAILSIRSVAHPVFNGHVIAGSENILPAYDYVVVGGGASGLTVANRLSEQSSTFPIQIVIASPDKTFCKGVTVLVIEAGDL